MKVILLAAGRGKRFGKRTKTLPKCLIPVGPKGEHLLSRYLDTFRALKMKEVVLVVGHLKSQVMREARKHGKGLAIRYIENKRYKLGSIVSLHTAIEAFDDDILIMDADVYFDAPELKKIISKKKSAFLLDTRSKSAGEEMMLMAKGGRLTKISKKVDPSLRIVGEATGFFKVVKNDAKILAGILDQMVKDGITGVEYEDAYNCLMEKRCPCYAEISGFWSEMDFEEDLLKIRKHAKL